MTLEEKLCIQLAKAFVTPSQFASLVALARDAIEILESKDLLRVACFEKHEEHDEHERKDLCKRVFRSCGFGVLDDQTRLALDALHLSLANFDSYQIDRLIWQARGATRCAPEVAASLHDLDGCYWAWDNAEEAVEIGHGSFSNVRVAKALVEDQLRKFANLLLQHSSISSPLRENLMRHCEPS